MRDISKHTIEDESFGASGSEKSLVRRCRACLQGMEKGATEGVEPITDFDGLGTVVVA